jgi:hypothetical protein
VSRGAEDAAARILLAIVGVFVLMFSFIVLAIMAAAREARQKRRREVLAVKAKELKLTFDASKHASFAGNYRFLDKLWHARGGNRKSCINVMTGELDSHRVTLFDYYYVTDSNKVWWWAPSWETHCFLSFMIVNMDSNFPELTIAKEGFFSKIAQAIGFDDIDFESHEFSRRYKVKSKDKKFAYDFCNARMIDYLLDQPIVAIEVEKHLLALGFDDQPDEHRTDFHLSHLLKIRSLIPNYVFEAHENVN